MSPPSRSLSRSISSTGMPAARAPSPSSSGVSPTCSASPGSHPASSRAEPKIPGSGLRWPASAEETTPSNIPASPQRSSTRPSEQSQLETTTSFSPRSRRPREGRLGVGIGAEADRVDELVHRELDPELGREISSAQRSRRSASDSLVAPLVGVLLVVGHLLAHRRDQGLVARPLRHGAAQGDPGRLQLDQRPECIQKYSLASPRPGILRMRTVKDRDLLAAARQRGRGGDHDRRSRSSSPSSSTGS